MYRLILLIFLFSAIAVRAQNNEEKLAAQYFSEKEYAKAADIYDDLAKKQPESIYYYENLMQCYILMKDFKSAEKLVDKRIKKFEYNYLYRVDKGYLFGLQELPAERDKVFAELLAIKLSSIQEIDNLANAFLKRRFYEQALAVYLQGRKSLKNETLFTFEVADLYFVKSDLKNGTAELVNYAGENDWGISDVKDKLSMSYTGKKDYSVLAEVVLEKLQKKPDNIAYNELLIWSFIQQKDWQGAFIQSKAVDKRTNGKGIKLIELGWLCLSNEEYSLAVQCFDYAKKSPDGEYFYQAQQGILQTGLMQIKAGVTVDSMQLRALEKEYLSFLSTNGDNWQTAEQMQQLAELYIYYLHETSKGVEQLNKALKLTGIDDRTEALCKLSLGDAMLIDGDPWEADLLYKQVEKAYNTDPLGQEAKFRYARLCYYRGEFEWSQTQLDVLKEATTQLISNNAMRLWLLIQDNIGLDSNIDAMTLYAQADFLIFRNKLKEASLLLDNIPTLYPNHSLADEIYFSKALIAEKQHNYNDAIVYYTKVFKDFSFDILADNALYNLARMYEFQLKEPEKAKALYEKIILNYTGSLFANDARKRYRILRGDPPEKSSDTYWD